MLSAHQSIPKHERKFVTKEIGAAPARPTLWFRALAPIAVTLYYFTYIQALYTQIMWGSDWWRQTLLLPMIPPLVLELWMTRRFEARRGGWKPTVIIALIGRLLFLGAWMAVFFWYVGTFRGTQDYIAGPIGFWPMVATLFIRADPLPFILGVAISGLLYALVTVRRQRLRFATTIFLPLFSALSSFALFYFQFGKVLDWPHAPRPAALERIFPTDRLPALTEEVGRNAYYSRDMYVDHDDRWLIASFGATFPIDLRHLTNLVWMELDGDRYQTFRQPAVGNSTRRFESECADMFYFVPWGRNIMEEYRPGDDHVNEYALPDEVDGMPLLRHSDAMFVHHACDMERVFVLNSRTPSILSWDTRNKVWDRKVNLARTANALIGGSAAVLKRSPKRGLFYVDEGPLPNRLLEFDEKTLEFRRAAPLGEDVFEVAVSPDGRFLYVSTHWTIDILKVDADTLQVLKRIPGGYHCRKMVFSRDGRWLIGGSYTDGNMFVIDTVTDERLLSFWATQKIEGAFATDRYAYIFGADGIFRIAYTDLQAMIDREKRR